MKIKGLNSLDQNILIAIKKKNGSCTLQDLATTLTDIPMPLLSSYMVELRTKLGRYSENGKSYSRLIFHDLPASDKPHPDTVIEMDAKLYVYLRNF